jgi:UDP-glucose 4-epimerase
MSKILVTGSSGYIGSHLCQILKKDSTIIVHGLDKNNPIVAIDKFYKQNILNLQTLEEEYDCVIHLAAEVSVGESVKDPIKYYTTNVVGTLNVLEHIKTKRLVVASTGAAEQLNSPYGISKKAMEEVVFQYCKNKNLPVTVFRFYNVVGSDGIAPTNPDGLFYALINAINTGKFTIFGNDYNTIDGTCIRDYCHVNEICNALIAGISDSTNQIENLGHGVGTSVKEMIELFKAINHCEFEVAIGPRREGDIETSVLSNPSKLMKKIYAIEELLQFTK